MEPWQEPDLKSSSVLIVDDHQATVTVLEALLQRAGFCNVSSTTDSRELLAAFHRSRPDLLLLDLEMPHVDGFAVMEQLTAELPSQSYIPILMLTGNTGADTRRRALARGASDFLTKPLNISEAMLRIRNLLRTRWIYTELQRQNVALEPDAHDITGHLSETQKEILDRLATAAEYRDDSTGQHTRRVSQLTAIIARRLRLPEEYVKVLQMGATLHDIGKIGVPDELLKKPGRLTPDEFASVQVHARIGGAILGNTRFPVLQVAREIALSHHEHWDGTGYPAGLSGHDIPLSGRIVAVADVFDALTQRRPYKEAWPVAEAIEELRRVRGTHLDPQCVDALLAALSRKVSHEPSAVHPPSALTIHSSGQNLQSFDSKQYRVP